MLILADCGIGRESMEVTGVLLRIELGKMEKKLWRSDKDGGNVVVLFVSGFRSRVVVWLGKRVLQTKHQPIKTRLEGAVLK